MDTKECSECRKQLTLTMFQTEKRGYTRNTCKQCRLIQIKANRDAKNILDKLEVITKECSNCKKNKPSNDFNKLSISPDGLDKRCRSCFKELRHRKKAPVVAPSDKMLTCIKCNTTQNCSNFRSTKKSETGYFNICNTCWKPSTWNKEKQKASEKKYVSNNPEKMKAKWKKAATNPTRIIRDRLNHRIVDAMKSVNTRKDNKTGNYTGCSMPYLKIWFEFHFTDTINWNNYGDWHIDHVLPCSHFDLTKVDDQMKCFNWQNLRPCLKLENMEKGNKIIESVIEEQKRKVLKFLEVNPLPNQSGDSIGGAE